MRRDPVFSLVGSVVRGDASTSGSYFANRRVPLGSVDGCVDERLFPRACSVARVLAPRRIGPSRWQQSGGELGHPPIRPPDGGRASHGRLAQRTSESPRNKKGGTSLPRVQDPRTTPSNTIGHPGNASWKRRAPRLHRQRFAGPLPVLRTESRRLRHRQHYLCTRHSRMPPEQACCSCTSTRKAEVTTGLNRTWLILSRSTPNASAGSTGFH